MYDQIKIFSFADKNYNFLIPLPRRILEGLHGMHGLEIEHCDLMSEDILLSDCFAYRFKVIDFGSSSTKTLSTIYYEQSRFYRAPEVILGIPYSSSIEKWPSGCLACELFTGWPLLPGEDDRDQIMKIRDFYPTGIPLIVPEHEIKQACVLNLKTVINQNLIRVNSPFDIWLTLYIQNVAQGRRIMHL